MEEQVIESSSSPVNETVADEVQTTADETVDNTMPTDESDNLYGNNDHQEEVKEEVQEETYVNFEDENSQFSPFMKDIFKSSKITNNEYKQFMDTIENMSSKETFTRDINEIYGDQAMNVLNDYRNLTSGIFTPQETELINKLPSVYKTLMLKMGKALGERIDKVKSDYGVSSQQTMATPEITKANASERFNKLTHQLMNGRLSSEEYQRIKQERLELANYL